MNRDWAKVVNSISEHNDEAKIFIYTNGTYGHGEDGLNAMKCKDSFLNRKQ